ncbi:MAG: hypothetical protein IKI90_01190 [Treponema sp.]|nr:hypothetical protein [Treponema sp.]
MKSIKKIALAVLALGFVAMTQVFAAKAPTVVATYAIDEVAMFEEGGEGTATITFYSDKTFVMHIDMDQDVQLEEGLGTISMKMDLDAAAGKYKGDPTKDGKLTLTATKTMSEEGATSEEFLNTMLAAFFSGEPIVITSKEMPLVDIPKKEQETIDVVIKDGELDFDGEKFYRVVQEGK